MTDDLVLILDTREDATVVGAGGGAMRLKETARSIAGGKATVYLVAVDDEGNEVHFIEWGVTK